ncbi:MAG: hypothetical protein H0X62_08585, partial [Bacteroidetes bacterium]|nr:hypothetical protein [Bacteroidota bacterium]
GIAYVTTPNFNSLSKKFLGPKWNILNYPEHLSYYTCRTLKHAFACTGFNLIKINTSGFSYSRFKSSNATGLLKNEETNIQKVKSKDEKIRTFFEKNIMAKMLKGTINYCLDKGEMGDSIKAFFIKPE